MDGGTGVVEDVMIQADAVADVTVTVAATERELFIEESQEDLRHQSGPPKQR